MKALVTGETGFIRSYLARSMRPWNIYGSYNMRLLKIFRVIARRSFLLSAVEKPIGILSVLIEYAFKSLKKELSYYKIKMAFFKKDSAYNILKAKSILGYKPEFSLKRNIHLTVNRYMDNGYI